MVTSTGEAGGRLYFSKDLGGVRILGFGGRLPIVGKRGVLNEVLPASGKLLEISSELWIFVRLGGRGSLPLLPLSGSSHISNRGPYSFFVLIVVFFIVLFTVGIETLGLDGQ